MIYNINEFFNRKPKFEPEEEWEEGVTISINSLFKTVSDIIGINIFPEKYKYPLWRRDIYDYENNIEDLFRYTRMY